MRPLHLLNRRGRASSAAAGAGTSPVSAAPSVTRNSSGSSSVIDEAVTGFVLKNVGFLRRQTNINGMPSSNIPIPITSAGPTPLNPPNANHAGV